ncbi:hypothetical protein [Nitrosomonas sp.]|uniref:hypothetical protein n=1 Tax=Nitrosomonas sp. TaxID=42353 RepID=UPI0025EF483D|nr:hypothetical protein [Nitrosomonas sp.]MBS0587222.1 hypothetical protein [Pseudomonadota bacterium]
MNQEIFTWRGYDENSAAHRTLQGFLVMDVQYSSQHADELHSGIQEYRNGKRKAFDGSGNGYEFECHPEGLFIDCLYEGDPLTPVTVEYDTVLRALTEWSEMCKELERKASQ